MATYKLIQDIEAEDHILGPLSLRQFIFALVAVFCFYMCFLGIAKHIFVLWMLFAPPGLFFTFFAFPWGRDQPTEIWALAKLRFLFKPRRRIWDQSGVKELVTITAPKTVEPTLTDGLSQTEVKSRLNALASTLDSRGWAVKGVAVNAYSNPNPLVTMATDRLIAVDSMPQQVPNYEVHASDDILDETSNPVAQQFDQMIARSEETHRQTLLNQLNETTPSPGVAAPSATASSASPATDYWFMTPQASAAPRPGKAAFAPAQVQQPGNSSVLTAAAPSAAEEALASQLKAQNSNKHIADTHLRTIQPLGSQPPGVPPPAANAWGPASPASPDPAILSLANNNDLNVATLAREAHKAKHDDEPPQDGEVVVSLR